MDIDRKLPCGEGIVHGHDEEDLQALIFAHGFDRCDKVVL
jgi:hypothetical protein